jgi:cysteine-S-conjugate beta-lyase
MSIHELRKRVSTKWRTYGENVLPMHVAEMDFEVAAPVRAKLIELVERSDMGYLGPLPELAPAFENYAQRHWGWQPKTDNLWLATDVAVAVVETLRVLAEPGDRVVISTPVYSSFMKWLAEVHMQPADAPLKLVGARWQLDLDAIEREFQAGAKIYLLCNPHNPVGTVHTRAELSALADLALKYDAVVISDEIHGPLTFESGAFVPYLSIGEAARETGILATSTSKSYNFAGLKAAFMTTESAEIKKLLASLPPAMHYRASLLGAFAMVTCYEQGDQWLVDTLGKIAANRELLVSELAAKLPALKVFDHAATYLAWVDASALGENPAAEIMRAGVSVVPGPDHAPPTADGPDARYRGFIRFNFATEPELIVEAVDRIAKL